MKKIHSNTLSSNLSAVAVIMAGGSGTRFWPLSRTSRPKQFLPLAGEEQSLIQATAARVSQVVSSSGVLVVTAEHQTSLVQEQLPSACVLSEPSARNTAACIGLAAVYVQETLGDVPLLCLPADHVVRGLAEIVSVYQKAIEIAGAHDVLVTIGIKPTSPETGYGYIQRGDPHTINTAEGTGAFQVSRFVEKPSRETAEQYLASGDFFWNSGMFVWRPSVLLAAFKMFLPDTLKVLEEIRTLFKSPEDTYQRIADLYAVLPSVSIDVGVLEEAKNVVMLPGHSFEWSDVGSWSSWAEMEAEGHTDEHENVVRGEAVLFDSTRCAVVGGKKLIAGIGVSDLIIVDTDDALLICRRDAAQDVKKVVDLLKDKGRTDLL